MIMTFRTEDETEKFQYLVATSGLEFLKAVNEFYSIMKAKDRPDDISSQFTPKEAEDTLRSLIDKHVMIKL